MIYVLCVLYITIIILVQHSHAQSVRVCPRAAPRARRPRGQVSEARHRGSTHRRQRPLLFRVSCPVRRRAERDVLQPRTPQHSARVTSVKPRTLGSCAQERMVTHKRACMARITQLRESVRCPCTPSKHRRPTGTSAASPLLLPSDEEVAWRLPLRRRRPLAHAPQHPAQVSRPARRAAALPGRSSRAPARLRQGASKRRGRCSQVRAPALIAPALFLAYVRLWPEGRRPLTSPPRPSPPASPRPARGAR